MHGRWYGSNKHGALDESKYRGGGWDGETAE